MQLGIDYPHLGYKNHKANQAYCAKKNYRTKDNLIPSATCITNNRFTRCHYHLFRHTSCTVVIIKMNNIVARPYERKTSNRVHSTKHHRVFRFRKLVLHLWAPLMTCTLDKALANGCQCSPALSRIAHLSVGTVRHREVVDEFR